MIDVMAWVVSIAIAGLFMIAVIIRENYRETKRKLALAALIKKERDDAVQRSRASIEGRVYEQLIPILPNWPYTPSDARFIASPCDYIVFDGMSTGNPTEVIIVEVKKGKSFTTPIQNKIKKLIQEGKVRWETIKLE
jgi:predicted Holliday junction resolvase-like endonuclease